MLKVTVIGHIGQDAIIREWNGQHFAAFSLAHTETYTDGKGVKHENTEWISCLKKIKDSGSPLVPLLKKGMKLYVEGQLSKKIYEKNSKTECGLNCNVSVLELLTPKNDSQSYTGPLKGEPNPITTEPVGTGDGTDLPF